MPKYVINLTNGNIVTVVEQSRQRLDLMLSQGRYIEVVNDIVPMKVKLSPAHIQAIFEEQEEAE